MSPDEIDAALFRARVPAIAMLRTANQTDPGTPGCWFGGQPTLPPDIPWPIYQYRNAELGISLDIPMHFLAQINLERLPLVAGLPKLPRHGALYVFYDPLVAPRAHDGSDMAVGRGASVIYHATAPTGHANRDMPEMPDPSVLFETFEYPSKKPPKRVKYRRWAFDPVVIDSYPGGGMGLPSDCWDRLQEVIAEGNVKLDRYLAPESFSRRDRISGALHTLFGHSQAYRLPSGDFAQPEGGVFVPLPEQRIPFLVFSPDRQLHHDYIDGFGVAFWIRRADLDRLDFSKISVKVDRNG